MQIAVATAHEPLHGTLSEQRLQCRCSIAAGGIELIDGNGIKPAHGTKLCGVAFDDGGNGGKPAFTVRARRLVVGSQNRIGHGRRKRWIDRLRYRDTVERLAVVEPRQFDRPFDGSAGAVDFEGAIGITRDGDNAPVELGGVADVDLQFFLAGTLALFQRRIVEERQAARPA